MCHMYCVPATEFVTIFRMILVCCRGCLCCRNMGTVVRWCETGLKQKRIRARNCLHFGHAHPVQFPHLHYTLLEVFLSSVLCLLCFPLFPLFLRNLSFPEKLILRVIETLVITMLQGKIGDVLSISCHLCCVSVLFVLKRGHRL